MAILFDYTVDRDDNSITITAQDNRLIMEKLGARSVDVALECGMSIMSAGCPAYGGLVTIFICGERSGGNRTDNSQLNCPSHVLDNRIDKVITALDEFKSLVNSRKKVRLNV